MVAELPMPHAGAQPSTRAASPPPELSARGRLEELFDAGTFTEIDAQVHHRARHFGMDSRHLPGDGVVCGWGDIDGRVVFAYSQDRRVMGGSLGEAHAQKIVKVMDLAGQGGRPLVGINDSGGARIQEGVEALAGYGAIFRRNTRLSGVVPQISLLMGPCAGGAVYSPALTDFVVMVTGASCMFVTGPKVVEAVTGERIGTEALGGADVHARKSGVAHAQVDSELEALDLARRILAYLPANNCEAPPQAACHDPIDRPLDGLEGRVPREPQRPYEVADVVEAVMDAGSFLQVRAAFAANLRVGLARLGGRPVGVVANNPAHLAGVIDIDAARKGAQWVRLCNAFGLPIVSFVDVPGFLPGCSQEHQGIIDHGAKLAYAYCEAQVPKLSVILRKAYGGAYIVMGSKTIGGDINYAWPGAQIAVMGAAGATEILHARQIAADPDPAAARARCIQAYEAEVATSKVALSRGLLDGVIAPADTRRALWGALRALAHKREAQPFRRNGNVPL